MARKTLAELTAAFAQKATGGSTSSDQSWKKFFPFWKMPDDSTCIIRFLPDVDEDNPLGFLVENYTHTLYVNGDKKVVPCMHHMHGEHCPICELSRSYYNEAKDAEREGNVKEKERLEGLGKKYYRKLSYIGQILIIDSPIEQDTNQLIKLIDLGPKIFAIINAAFKSGDLECKYGPDDLKGGYNFRIKKTKDGKWSSYSTSSFSPKQSDVEDSVIEQLELYNLKDWRTQKMDRATIDALLAADRTGSSYSETDDSDDRTETVINEVAEKKVEEKKVEPVVEPKVQETVAPAESAPASSKANDVIAQIKARAAAKKAEAEAAAS